LFALLTTRGVEGNAIGPLWAEAEASGLRVVRARLVVLPSEEAARALAECLEWPGPGPGPGPGATTALCDAAAHGAPVMAVEAVAVAAADAAAPGGAEESGSGSAGGPGGTWRALLDRRPAGAAVAAAEGRDAAAAALCFESGAGGKPLPLAQPAQALNLTASSLSVPGVLLLPSLLASGSAGAALAELVAQLSAASAAGVGGGKLTITALATLSLDILAAEDLLEVYRGVKEVPEYRVGHHILLFWDGAHAAPL
jgi:hypothetical protein